MLFWGMTTLVLIFSTVSLFVISNKNEQDRLLAELDSFIMEKQVEINDIIATINDCGVYVRFDDDIIEMLNSSPQDEYTLNRNIQKLHSDIGTIYEMNFSNKSVSYSTTFYVNDELTVSSMLLEGSAFAYFDTGVTNLYSSRRVRSEEWYRNTIKQNGKLYCFERGGRLYVSQMIENAAQYRNDVEYMGVSVVAIKLDEIFMQLENISGYETDVALKKDGQVIMQSEDYSDKHFANKLRYFNDSFETEAGIDVFISIPRNHIGVQSSSLVALLGVFFFVTLVFALLLSLVMSRVIVDPISNLIHFMQDLKEKQNFGQHCKKTSDDEIGQLYDAFNYMTDCVKAMIDEVEIQTKKRNEVEYKLYQNRINPHMLYNTLDSISWKALMQGNTEIVEMNRLLAEMYRYSVRSGESMVKLQSEFDCVKKYIELQRLRCDYEIVLTINENDCGRYYVPSFILQPLVENTIIHGHQQGLEKLIIKIDCVACENVLTIVVENNGKECDTEEINELLTTEVFTQKTGIRNVNARVNIKFGNGYGLRANKADNGNTQMVIKMPTKNYLE